MFLALDYASLGVMVLMPPSLPLTGSNQPLPSVKPEHTCMLKMSNGFCALLLDVLAWFWYTYFLSSLTHGWRWLILASCEFICLFWELPLMLLVPRHRSEGSMGLRAARYRDGWLASFDLLLPLVHWWHISSKFVLETRCWFHRRGASQSAAISLWDILKRCSKETFCRFEAWI